MRKLCIVLAMVLLTVSVGFGEEVDILNNYKNVRAFWFRDNYLLYTNGVKLDYANWVKVACPGILWGDRKHDEKWECNCDAKILYITISKDNIIDIVTKYHHWRLFAQGKEDRWNMFNLR